MGTIPCVTVLHVVPEDSYRGSQAYAGRLRDTLRDHDYQRHVVASLFASSAGALRPDVQLGVPAGAMRRLGLDPRVVLALRREVEWREADLVVAHGGEALKYVVAARGSAPVVYYKIGLSTAELSRTSRTLLYRFLMRRVALGVGVSTAIRDQLHHILRLPRSRTAVIPNGRDPYEFHPGQLGQKSAPPLVLFVGQLEPGKRPSMFLDIVERVRDLGVDFNAAMVGDGALRPQIEDRAARLGVPLLGVRQDVPDILRSATALVMTSAQSTEGMPGVLVEAGLTGIPVVTTSAAGATDVVKDEVTGVVVDSDDPDECAAAVGRLCRDSVRASQMGAAARAFCLRNFTIAHSSGQWCELVDGLTDGRPRG